MIGDNSRTNVALRMEMVVVGRQATDEFQDGAARLKENCEGAMTSVFQSIAKTEGGRLLEDKEGTSDSHRMGREGKPWARTSTW